MGTTERKWKLLNKIQHIISGWIKWFKKEETEQSKKRLAICMKCPNKIKIGRDWVCSECYCVCKVKVLVPEERCVLNKW